MMIFYDVVLLFTSSVSFAASGSEISRLSCGFLYEDVWCGRKFMQRFGYSPSWRAVTVETTRSGTFEEKLCKIPKEKDSNCWTQRSYISTACTWYQFFYPYQFIQWQLQQLGEFTKRTILLRSRLRHTKENSATKYTNQFSNGGKLTVSLSIAFFFSNYNYFLDMET